MKHRNTIFTTILLVLGCFGLLPGAQAVSPAPDGGYPGGNTAEGQSALFSLTTGGFNTAIGYLSLRSNTTNSFNTAVGAGTLLANTGDENTATGAGALLSNTTGSNNTANGAFALFSNTTGSSNTANGQGALFSNTTGVGNTAIGVQALYNNTTGVRNTAIGLDAGVSITGDGNVCIGDSVSGGAGENNTTRIRNIGSTPIVGGTNVVIIGTGGKGDETLGYASSSRRYKEDVKPMDKDSEVILALKPVTFQAKGDTRHVKHYGLIAEDVAMVDPDLAVYNPEGKPETLRFDSINAMVLNEFLKEHKAFLEEHRKVQEQGATIMQQRKDFETAIAQQQKQIETLTAQLGEQAAQIQKVSAQLATASPPGGGLNVSKTAPQIVLNNQ